jgi:hypothetical protein
MRSGAVRGGGAGAAGRRLTGEGASTIVPPVRGTGIHRWLAAALLPVAAHATTGRAVALRSQFSIPDDTDVFRFPSVAPQHGDRATLDFTPSAEDGNAGVLWGRDLTLGLYFNRPPPFDDLAEIDAIYAGVDAPPMRPLLDLIVAGRLGEHNALGLSLAPSLGLDTTDVDVVGDGRGRLSTGSQAFALDAALGWSYLGEALSNDLSFALTFNSLSQQDAGETVAQTAGTPSFALRDRTIWSARQDRALGAELLLARRAYDVDQPQPSIEGRYGRTLVQLDAGPRFVFARRVTMAAALRFTFEKLSGTIDGQGGRPGTLGVGFPGAVGAVEARVTGHWFLRAGADYLFRYTLVQGEALNGLDAPQTRTTRSTFSWSLGLGYDRAGFTVDALLASDLVLNGPNFVGGTAPGLFASLSGAYRWE